MGGAIPIILVKIFKILRILISKCNNFRYFLYLYSVLHLVNHLCILKTVSVPECCLEEFHSLLCTIVNKCHLLLPVVYDYTENLESKEAMYYLNYRPVARGVLGVLKTPPPPNFQM